MNYIEFIGIGATLLILVSMCFKTVSFKGSLLMRVLNIAGSVVFVVHGALLPAISTAVLNGCLVIVNTIHLILLIKEHKKKEKEQNEISDLETTEEKSTTDEVEEKKD